MVEKRLHHVHLLYRLLHHLLLDAFVKRTRVLCELGMSNNQHACFILLLIGNSRSRLLGNRLLYLLLLLWFGLLNVLFLAFLRSRNEESAVPENDPLPPSLQKISSPNIAEKGRDVLSELVPIDPLSPRQFVSLFYFRPHVFGAWLQYTFQESLL